MSQYQESQQEQPEQPEQEYDYEESTASKFVKFENPGDQVEGRVVAYNADEGATTFDGDPCGYIDLHDPYGLTHRVSLDKPALKDPVVAANTPAGPVVGLQMKIVFAEWATNKQGTEWKRFRVYFVRGSERDKAAYQGTTPPPAQTEQDRQQRRQPARQNQAQRQRQDENPHNQGGNEPPPPGDDDLPF